MRHIQGMAVLTALLVGCVGRPQPEVADFSVLRAHSSEWERIVAAEDARARMPAELEVLRQGLGHEESEIRRIAVRGLGRLERAEVAGDIAALLVDPAAGVRGQAANAMAQAARGGAVSQAALETALGREMEPSAAGVMAEALGRMPHADAAGARRTLDLLVPRLNAGPEPVEVLGITRGLFFLARQQTARGAFDDRAVEALRAVASPAAARQDSVAVRIRTVGVAAITAAGIADEALGSAALRDGAWQVRREGVLAAATLPDPAAVRRLLAPVLQDSAGAVRVEGIRAYGRLLMASDGCAPIRAGLNDPDLHVRLLAIDLLGSCPDRTAADLAVLDSLSGSIIDARWHEGAHALVSLATVDPSRAAARLAQSGLPENPFARAYAARAFGILRDQAALRTLARDSDVNVRTAAVRGLVPLAGGAADDVYLAQLAVDDSQLLQAAAAALEGTSAAGAPAALLDALDRVSRARSETSRDARRALLRRVGELGGMAHVERVRPYLHDFDPVIADLAADVVGEWTGARPESNPAAPPGLPLPTFEEAARLADSVAEIEMMEGGRVLLRLLPFEAPTNAARFARLAESGFFDGLTFHRVVPNFVVQGGSAHANEYTGDGPFTRDELGLASHWRGSVGLSTRGRDTGDGQIFFNLVDNVRLDHDYTVFAVVVEGMDVVAAMQEGARIRSVRLRSR